MLIIMFMIMFIIIIIIIILILLLFFGTYKIHKYMIQNDMPYHIVDSSSSLSYRLTKAYQKGFIYYVCFPRGVSSCYVYV